MVRPVLALAVTLALALAPARAAADDGAMAVVNMDFVERGATLYVTGSVTSLLIDAGAYERFENGLATTVVIRLWMYPEGKSRPVAFVLLHRQCVYDLWDETFQCAVSGPGGRTTYKVRRRDEALNILTRFEQLPLADLATVAIRQRYVVAAIAELNPVSKETMAEVRRWLSQGSGGGLDRGGSFFGSFVSVFVNLKVPEADRVVRLRSRPFFRKPPAPTPAPAPAPAATPAPKP